MKLNYSKKILIFSGLILFFVLLGNVVSFNFLIDKVLSINNKVAQVEISTKQRERNVSLTDSVQASQVGREILNTYFVSSGDAKTAEFIETLEGLARQAGLSANIRTVNYEPISEFNSTENIQFIRMILSVSGSWSKVFGFLSSLENLPKVIKIANVNLNSSPALNSKNRENNWTAEIDLSIAQLKN